jgi:uncharacterized membrane protein YkvA (DUF1232 family)
MTLLQRLRHWASGIKQDSITLWFACRLTETPWLVRCLCLFIVAYALSPIDLIPDFIPVLGYLDDLLLLPLLIKLSVALLPQPVISECRQQAKAWQTARNQKPRSPLGASMILLIWGMLIYGSVELMI